MKYDVPGFIRGYIEKSVEPKVNEKKQQIFDEMKIGTSCAEAKTIPECKILLS